jgi:MAC/Perforin domain
VRTATGQQYLSQGFVLAQGYDVYGKYDVTSVTMPLYDPVKAGTHPFTFLDKDYVLPSYVTGVEQTAAYVESDAASTREEFQNSLAIKAQVKAKYGAFSGQMASSYGREFTQNSEYSYAYYFANLPLAILTLSDIADTYLTDSFKARLEQLPERVGEENLDVFADFFEDYGAYVVSRVTLGAILQYYVAVSNTTQLTKQQISAQMELEYKGLFASAGVSTSVQVNDTWKS